MRVVVAPDKFKGSLTASQVAEAVAAGVERAVPGAEVDRVPVADGGEGTLEAAEAAGFTRVTVQVAGPTGAPLSAALAIQDRTAVIEMAAASGLAALPGGTPAAREASSLGTGQLIRAALDAGCTEIVLGVGGSACTDGGAGLLQGLGARLLDADGDDLPLGGAALRELDRVDLDGLDPRLGEVQVLLASDVDNPLLGARGAAAVYGPQKGASPGDVEVLEAGLRRWVEVLTATVGPRAAAAAERPGAGAAGGLGYGAIVALGAIQRSGIAVVLDLTGLAEHLPSAHLVVTGEGSLDAQSLHGKAPVGVADAARAAGVPVVAVAGRCLLTPEQLHGAGISAAYALTDLEPDPQRCMTHAGPLLERLCQGLAQDWLTDREPERAT